VAPVTRRQGLVAAGLFLLGVFLNAAAGVVSVPLLADWPVLTLTWLRYASMMVLFLPFALRDPALARLPAWPQARGLVLLGLTSLAALASFMAALKGLPVATATGLFFCYPFLAVGFSALLLAEPVALRDWLRVAAGLGGVMLLLRPFAAGADVFALAALASGVFVAAKTVLTRSLGLSMPLLAMAAGEAAVAALVLLPFADFGLLAEPAQAARLLLYLALANAARLAVVLALARGRVAALAPLGYLELAFAAALQVLLIGTLPGPRDLIALGIILAAGLVIPPSLPNPGSANAKRAP
jgi:drug/metabolite transporter (DMT)-like permease